ncbi:general substrate transporter [Aspergillus heteromorphus CBS 117.55]|uniref:General substrate transporter n=1 Tax=Aspergillus heteromorphus CBS 117.55 TaxID=1448321 RepID=A0A317WDF3_9EURO|nr:general substrate transporter [Aspergillus heteromorphus CBS 117.55]PWY82210.1 general substrate transporter [Aspergillus heteromorphus CBS 117.55]
MASATRAGFALIAQNPYLLGVASFSTLGGLLFGYDQGVVSGVGTMQSLGARFPRVYADTNFKGWFVSTLLLAPWFGSLINGPIVDRLGRKVSINIAVVIFVIGPAIQSGRAIADVAIGQLTMVVPLYISELDLIHPVSITLGILISYWLDYGTNYIGGTRCAPSIPYTGGTSSSRTFDPYTDIPRDGHCTSQSEASWRLPLALQILPAIILGLGILFFPDSPRWLLMRARDDDALKALSRLRQEQDLQAPRLVDEYLEIKASVMWENGLVRERFNGLVGWRRHVAQYTSLITTWSHFKRLTIGSCVMFFQQFMGCNDGNTTSLLATGVYGIINTLSTLPALFLIDRLGRRPLLMCGAAGTCISLVIVGGLIGATPIGWVLPSEIFNLSIRSKAISITTSATWMCNFIIGLVTPDMLDSITWGTYIFFAAFCLLAFGFTFFFIPETRGKTLEGMDLIFGDTAAHEEKRSIIQIEAQLRATHDQLIDRNFLKPIAQEDENAK